MCIYCSMIYTFLSTLSLRRATSSRNCFKYLFGYFYPRSPCGERPMTHMLRFCVLIFLSTLSLRRATGRFRAIHNAQIFLSTLSLRRATVHYDNYNLHCVISIHALLAESDSRTKSITTEICNFYPRSPCGERRVHYDNYNLHCVISIHALLAESDVLGFAWLAPHAYFYPRSPCGERHSARPETRQRGVISIHALLAESDLVL